MSNIDALRLEIVEQVKVANDIESLEDVRVKALGKKGRVTDLMKTLGKMDPEERKEMGQALNRLKTEISEEIDTKAKELRQKDMQKRLETEGIDITLSPRPERLGSVHPLNQAIEEIMNIFVDMGFNVAEGPDIEDEFHNFDGLNFPPNHPARQMHDTFYMPDDPDAEAGKEKRLLRTHTSTVQIHVMNETQPPIKSIMLGKVYRSDYDATHTPMFHQIEGLVIDKQTHMGHLKGCLIDFCKAFFGLDDFPVRFRPHYFPFTEPSAEMDIGCDRSGGKMVMGQGNDWLEVLGCGMVHPNVLKNCGIDPDEYQGFAFGAGLDRLAMLKYGIPDLRTFFEPDLRWLGHYRFGAYDQPSKTFR